MSEHRSKLKIYRDLLAAVESDHVPTWIMYKSRLSWKNMMKHLEELMRRGLVEEIQIKTETRRKPRRGYALTPKGKKLLASLNDVLKLLGEDEG